ncbi:hypothetical protein AHAS_Ahas03G0151200 [Arachis hypogaea]
MVVAVVWVEEREERRWFGWKRGSGRKGGREAAVIWMEGKEEETRRQPSGTKR